MMIGRLRFNSGVVLAMGLLVLAGGCRGPRESAPKIFPVHGVVREVRMDAQTLLVTHEAIAGYMPAMTMPFRFRDSNQLGGVNPGDTVTFRLIVTAEESWIEAVEKTSAAPSVVPTEAASPAASNAPMPRRFAEVIADVTFTNEMGAEVKWGQFEGQALALTFLFTRCPLPEYCPRLARNFSAASRRLAAMPDAPTNWHFLALTFDPEFDRPAVLGGYARSYGADSRHWNLLATSPENTVRIAQLFNLNYVREGGTINHDFRTVIIDSPGRIHAVWPMGGDTTDALVSELIKAARMTNASDAKPSGR